ncbi:hypothetical protein [Pseudomonas sp.]|uniref:hypothetical protein n=1 Tax=Pseudomonas sp. TaxID=306 RepID=UPI0025CD0B77|nr:hypothetical protein [Pseudomonas sp.]
MPPTWCRAPGLRSEPRRQSANALMGTEKVAGFGFGHERPNTVHTAGVSNLGEVALT